MNEVMAVVQHIQQSTFDDAVKENIKDFDMTPEEAVDDAIKQFQTQGVNLDNIVKDASVFQFQDKLNSNQHFVITTVRSLGEIIDNDPPLFDIIIPALQTIHNECLKGLSYRCLTAQNGGYKVLIKCVEKCFVDADLLVVSLNTFCSFCEGQPDYLDSDGADKFLEVLDVYPQNCDIVTKTVKILRFNCIQHEGNRVMLYEKGVVYRLVQFLNFKDSDLIVECCKLIRVLTYDDDIRVPFGKGQELARSMVAEYNLLTLLSRFIMDYSGDVGVVSEFIFTLAKLSIRDDFCQQVNETGVVPVILQILANHIDYMAVVKNSCFLLKALAGNDKIKSEIGSKGGPEALAMVFEKYQGNAGVCESACGLCAALCLRNSQHCPQFVEANVHEFIVQAMKLHLPNLSVQKPACMALRNLVSHCPQLIPAVLQTGVEPVLNAAHKKHGAALYEAKSALRDLGLKVAMEELWTGTKGPIEI